MNQLQNRAISASAGTGKTFRLAHRYLGLMAASIPPDRICALTFTRKAAGEIFDKIVARLAAAATDGRTRAETRDTIAREGLPAPEDTPEAYIALLRQLLDQSHRLRIGTLDSFILGIVNAFPLELGISPDTRPMDGDSGEAQALRQAIFTRLFDPAQGAGKEGGALLSELRLARAGQEDKQLGRTLDRLITDGYDFYRNHKAHHWGDTLRIWPGNGRWWEHPTTGNGYTADALAAALETVFGASGRPRSLGETCARLARAGMEHALDKPCPDLSTRVAQQLMAAAEHDAPPTLTYYRQDYPVPAALWPDLRRAIINLIAVEVDRAASKTHGLRQVLERYDAYYNESLASGGPFTFEDLSRLLGTGAAVPSLNRGSPNPNRLYIDYRLDSQLDHWLLDEFQDTSDNQWLALENLIDEVMQDEERSFFYVGDVKQSIYGWRGGNHRLFHQVLAKYGGLGRRAIALESITRCYRSLPAVIDAVNAVFDDLAGWEPKTEGTGPRPDAVEAFGRFWERHESARKGEGEGYAALVEYESTTGKRRSAENEDEEEETLEPAAYKAVAAVLQEAGPSLAHLSVAVLVRDNNSGRACVDTLRRLLPGVPVVHEGKGGIVDHPVVTLLLALVRYAAHPGDTVALRHLQMSPLAKLDRLGSIEELPARVLGELQTHGFAATLRQWGAALGNLDAFGQQRLLELLTAAEAFDARGLCDADAFADHVAAYQARSSAEAGAVRVMTIHQAKGLGFDLVVVPFSANAKSFGKPGRPTFLTGDDWVLDPLKNDLLEAVGGAPLQAQEREYAEANFAQLCTLYVALTRARQALVMVIPAPAKNPTAIREADLLRERLVTETLDEQLPNGAGRILYQTGDRLWHQRVKVPDPAPADSKAAEPLPLTYAVELTRHEPSKLQEAGRAFPAHWLFNAEAGDVRAFGSAIHRLLERIEWLETADIEAIIAEWRRTAAESAILLNDVERQFRNCLKNDDIRRALSRPADAPSAEVWREAPFELVLEGPEGPQLAGGRFDRVVIERDAEGRAVRATVFDYKSNRIETEGDMRESAEGYAFQMQLYARAAAHLLNLDPSRVTALLLFTRKGWILPMANF